MWKRKVYSLPRPKGPYAVGFEDVEINRNLLDEAADISDGSRTVSYRVYYPCHKSSIWDDLDCLSNWIPSTEYLRGYGDFMGIPSILSVPALKYLAGHVKIPAVEKADFIRQKCPVMIFSHGLGGIRTTYSSIACSFASYGWVVLAMEHHDGSASISFENGNSLYYKPWNKAEKSEFQFRNEQLDFRVKEVKAALRSLEIANEAVFRNSRPEWLNNLAGFLDFSNFCMAGHSFGAATAIMASQLDENFKCCIALDPWMLPIPSTILIEAKRHVATLVINSDTFHWPSNLTSLKQLMESIIAKNTNNSAKSCIVLLVRNTGHHDQSDIPSIIPQKLLGRSRNSASLPHSYALLLNIDACHSFINKVLHLKLPFDPAHDVFEIDDYKRSIDLTVFYRK